MQINAKSSHMANSMEMFRLQDGMDGLFNQVEVTGRIQSNTDTIYLEKCNKADERIHDKTQKWEGTDIPWNVSLMIVGQPNKGGSTAHGMLYFISRGI